MRPSIVFVAPSLGPDVVAMTRMCEDANLLGSLITRSVLKPELARLLGLISVTRAFSRRPGAPVAPQRVSAISMADVVFYVALAFTGSRIRATDASFAYLDRFAARRIRPPIKAVLAREDCCLESFRRAKALGVKTIYQLPTAYWGVVRELMEAEMVQFPRICSAAEDPHEFAPGRTERKTAELDLADHVLCPSTFVHQSLSHYRAGSYKVLPFSIDTFKLPDQKVGKPVFLYAGNITLRKGVHRLLLAWKRLQAYRTHELRLIGDMFLSKKFLDDFRGMFTHIPRISREELTRHYADASAFVFNPVADGFGHVFVEAMSNATAVIASRNCGAPDVIKDGENGFLIDYGSDEQLDSALEWALAHPAELADVGHRGFQRVQRWTWDEYAKEFLDWLQPMLG
jgi:glycosyltransferase involved in cell wall biosynthesis